MDLPSTPARTTCSHEPGGGREAKSMVTLFESQLKFEVPPPREGGATFHLLVAIPSAILF